MAQNTNLNVTPYYDDFDKSKNFYRVLFRPGFPIQARELTSMQSVMQNQVENMGTHLFKDGAMVIPGQIGFDLEVDAIQVQESFLGADVENYRSQLTGKIITGLTSGVKAKVLYSISATTSEKGYITLYLKYIESGTESTGTTNTQQTFINNEQLVTDTEITFGTTLIEIGSPFAQLLPTAAIQTGSAAYVQTGVYFIRGFFVDVPYQYILLDQYGSTPKYRIGLEILESIITPEDDLSLNDNAAGTSNYAAPGSHRFRITTNLVKKLLTDEADKDFIELLRINGDKVENYAALTRNQHINVPGSAHIRQGELGDAFITRSSGGSAFDLGFDSDTPIRNTRANLSKLPREGISFNKRGRAVQNTNTIWDAMAEYSAVTSEGRVSAISKALKSQKETRSSLPTPNRRKPKGSSTVQKLIDQGIDESKAWDMYKAIDKAEGINNWINLFRKWELSNAAWTGRKLGATIPVAGAGFAGWGLIDNVKEAAVNPTKHNILKAGGSFVETTGEVVSAGGILAAPFTKGLSLGLVPVGEGIAAVGSGTEISTVLHENKEAIKKYASDTFQDKNLPKIRGRSGAKRAIEAKKLEQKQLQARFSPPPEQTTIPFVPSPEQEEWYWQGVSSTPWLR